MKIYCYRFTREVMQLKKTYQYLNLTQTNHNCENNRLTLEVMQLKKTYQYLNLTQPNHNCENNNINKYASIG